MKIINIGGREKRKTGSQRPEVGKKRTKSYWLLKQEKPEKLNKPEQGGRMTTKKKDTKKAVHHESKKAGRKTVHHAVKKAVHKPSSHTHKPAHQASKHASLQAGKHGAAKAHKAKGTEPEFQYIPVSNVEVMEQVRSNINTDSDSFKALVQSIKDRGILEPLLVTGQDGAGYTLLCGERRLLAAQQLGLETVPVRVVTTATEQDEIIAFQLTENLQREDLNPIDQAQGVLSYFQAKLPDKGYDVDGVMSELLNYKVRPERLSDEVTPTVGVIIEITGKSISTLFNGLSLLKLPDEIKMAVSDETLPVSQGYIFAANLDCPDRDKIFGAIMKTPVTNATLTNMLTAWKKPQPEPGSVKFVSVTKQVAAVQSWEMAIRENSGKYKKADLQKLLSQLQEFVLFVQQRMKPPSV